jgi:peptidyl-prolyl cis-trans isomerase SurA
MSEMGHRPCRLVGDARACLRALATAALAIVLLRGAASAQQAGAAPQPGAASGAEAAPQAATAPTSEERVPLDRLVAIVNGDLILESDLDTEARMVAFQPLRDTAPVTQDQLIDRLIDRDLILQQIALQPGPPITDAEVDDELNTLRKAIPECAAYHCETDAGWEKFAADNGFTLDDLRDRWRERMEVLRFIEQRFRMGIRISQAEIDDYYQKTLLPAYEKQKVAAPAEASIADHIQEILLQQQVNKLLDDWLASLRAQGSVRIVKPGEELP